MPTTLKLDDSTVQAPGGTNLLFLCLAQNCEDTFPTFLAHKTKLEARGIRCTALIGEDGSRDSTRRLILESVDLGISLVDTTDIQRIKGRFARMANARQMLLQRALDLNLIKDFVCVADLDNAIKVPPNPDAVIETLRRLRDDSTVFAVGATSTPVYYDLLSLKTEDLDCTGLASELEAAKSRPFTYHNFHRRKIYDIQRDVTKTTEIPCQSSFNGYCLYRGSDYRTGTYLRATGSDTICEHVTFHKSLSDPTGRHMIISPHIVLSSPEDHTLVNIVRFWSDRLRRKFATTNR